jgi:hypothetical protein
VSVLIWGTYLLGALVAWRLAGWTGFIVFAVVWTVITRVFRRQIVLALTHLSSKLGFVAQKVKEMPLDIHLSRIPVPSEAAALVRDALLGCGFVDAGAYSITELPKIGVTLLVHPQDGMLAAIESASSIGAHVNLHTLYKDMSIFTITNSELPAPRAIPPGVTRVQQPKCAPALLFAHARRERPKGDFRTLAPDDAPRIYAELYTMWTAFRKAYAA